MSDVLSWDEKVQLARAMNECLKEGGAGVLLSPEDIARVKNSDYPVAGKDSLERAICREQLKGILGLFDEAQEYAASREVVIDRWESIIERIRKELEKPA